MRLWNTLLTMACVLGLSTPSFAQSSTSIPAAERLISALTARGLDFVAAVQDLAGPGLRPARKADEAFDIAYESVVTRTAFDGDWAPQGLTPEDYRASFTRVDARYAQALETLAASLRSSDGT